MKISVNIDLKDMQSMNLSKFKYSNTLKAIYEFSRENLFNLIIRF